VNRQKGDTGRQAIMITKNDEESTNRLCGSALVIVDVLTLVGNASCMFVCMLINVLNPEVVFHKAVLLGIIPL